MSEEIDPRECIWMTAGVVTYRLCNLNFRCEECLLDLAIRQKEAVARSSPRESASAMKPVPWDTPTKEMQISKHLFYDANHIWARIEEGGTVRLGLDDFAQRLLGRVEAVKLPHEGDVLERGEEAWSLTSDLGEISFAATVAGEVCWTNRDLAGIPSLINQDSYGRGAVFAVEPTHLTRDLRRLTYGDRNPEWYEDEMRRLQEVVHKELLADKGFSATLNDGGLPVGNLFEEIHRTQALRSIPRVFLEEGFSPKDISSKIPHRKKGR